LSNLVNEDRACATSTTKLPNYPITESVSSVALVLGFHVTGFTAGAAVILAVLTEANVKLGTAEPAVLGAATAALGLITENADEILRHRRSLAEGIVKLQGYQRRKSGTGIPGLWISEYLDIEGCIENSKPQTANLKGGISNVV
jgi:hypothetical protein